MPHDDSKTCERLFGDLGGHHLMAPLFVSLNKTAPWSLCSALYITEFFDNGHGKTYLSFFSSILEITHWLHQKLSSQYGRLFHNTDSLNRADSETNKQCYSSSAITMAFLCKHVAPLKWFCRDSLSCPRFPHPLLLTPFLFLNGASLSPSLVVYVTFVCILARPISEPSFPMSHATDFFLFFTSLARSNSWCQQNMFFISLNKKRVWLRVFIPNCRRHWTLKKQKCIECNRESCEDNESFLIWNSDQMSRFKTRGCL